MQVGTNDFMSLGRGAGSPTGHLFHVELSLRSIIQREYIIRACSCDLFVTECKSRRRLISKLDATT